MGQTRSGAYLSLCYSSSSQTPQRRARHSFSSIELGTALVFFHCVVLVRTPVQQWGLRYISSSQTPQRRARHSSSSAKLGTALVLFHNVALVRTPVQLGAPLSLCYISSSQTPQCRARHSSSSVELGIALVLSHHVVLVRTQDSGTTSAQGANMLQVPQASAESEGDTLPCLGGEGWALLTPPVLPRL